MVWPHSNSKRFKTTNHSKHDNEQQNNPLPSKQHTPNTTYSTKNNDNNQNYCRNDKDGWMINNNNIDINNNTKQQATETANNNYDD